MKKLFLSLLITVLTVFAAGTVKADDFQDFIHQNTRCAVLVTANWAEKAEEIQTAFTDAENTYAGKYSFKIINIASPETKEFNKSNYIYTNLPYIVLYKEKGRMSRWINRDCILNSSCMKDKFELFAN